MLDTEMKKFLFSLVAETETPNEIIETAVKTGNLDLLRFFSLYEKEIKEKRKQLTQKQIEIFDLPYLCVLANDYNQYEVLKWTQKILKLKN